jgi:hypothetical protein
MQKNLNVYEMLSKTQVKSGDSLEKLMHSGEVTSIYEDKEMISVFSLTG